jgi:hypothetical protein
VQQVQELDHASAIMSMTGARAVAELIAETPSGSCPHPTTARSSPPLAAACALPRRLALLIIEGAANAIRIQDSQPEHHMG